MRILAKEGLTFDDVLLVPQYTDIHSRKDVSLKTRITKDIEIDLPIVSSNMDMITEHKMMSAMSQVGGIGILHRFMSNEEIFRNIEEFIEVSSVRPLAFSVGVSNDYKELIAQIFDIAPYEQKIVNIDIAHGACDRMVEAIKWIKQNYPIQVIAGNIATKETAKILIDAGADALKVGIGNGGVCVTREVAGAGVPLLTSISDCYEVAKIYDVPIICDGGIRKSSDAIKALAAGASSFITGSLLSGTDETPGEIIIKEDGTRYKKYRGMASRDAMKTWRGDSYDDVAAEGISTLVPIKGPAASIAKTLCAGIRSGMTYCNARNLEELRENAVFIRHTTLGSKENGAHLLNNR